MEKSTARLLFLLVSLLLTGPISALDLFVPAPEDAGKDYVDSARLDPYYVDAQLLEADVALLHELRLADKEGSISPPLKLNLDVGLPDEFTPESFEDLGPSRFLIYGSLSDESSSGTGILLVDHDLVVGTLRWPGLGIFEIRFVQGKVHAIHEVHPGYYVDCETLEPAPNLDTVPSAPTKQAGTPLIDLLVVYTRGARLQASPMGGIQNSIELAVAEANMAYQNSLVNHRLRLVATREVSYVETDRSEALDNITEPSDGFIDEVHDIRNEVGADVVSFFIDRGDGGVGWQMSSVNASFEDLAFNVVDQRVAATFLVLAHEVGHNMGAAHERGNGSAGAFLFSHALNTDSFTTVMNSVSSSTTIPFFSNPAVVSPTNGEPTGIGAPSISSADNVRTLNQTSEVVADFRTRRFDVHPQSHDVRAAGQSVSFAVSHDGPGLAEWEATIISGDDWVSFPGTFTGINSGSIRVDAIPNTSGLDRVATIEVRSMGAVNATVPVTVSQPSCDGPSPPVNVSASDGTIPGAVHISWDSVVGARDYRVYRSASPNGGFAPISGFISGTTFDDTSTPPSPPRQFLGCGSPPPAQSYYVITARDSCDEGEFSSIDSGFPGEPPPAKTQATLLNLRPTGDVWTLLVLLLILTLWRPSRHQG